VFFSEHSVYRHSLLDYIVCVCVLKTHVYANRHSVVYAHSIIRHETTTHAK